jgi:hypothetical protein
MRDAPRALRDRRVLAGGAIVLIWIVGLGLLARREFLRPMSERLAAAALQVHPSAHYYLIKRNGEVVGGGSSEVDTTGYGIVFRHQLFGVLSEGEPDTVTLRSRASYTPTLIFGGFRIDAEWRSGSATLAGQRVEDSLLTLTVNGTGVSAGNHQVVAREPLFLPANAALPVALLERLKPGLTAEVNVFDPLLQRSRTIPLRVARESLLVVVDSAGFDPQSRRWVAARTDTVRSWLLTSDSTSLRAWVDRTGAVVEATDGRGTRAIRSAYEIVFENWRLERVTRDRASPDVADTMR